MKFVFLRLLCYVPLRAFRFAAAYNLIPTIRLRFFVFLLIIFLLMSTTKVVSSEKKPLSSLFIPPSSDESSFKPQGNMLSDPHRGDISPVPSVGTSPKPSIDVDSLVTETLTSPSQAQISPTFAHKNVFPSLPSDLADNYSGASLGSARPSSPPILLSCMGILYMLKIALAVI